MMANNSRIHVEIFKYNLLDMIGSFIWLNIKMPYANISIIIYTWKFHHVNVISNFLKITNWNIGIQPGITYKVY
jgi:hypothetical protein